MGTSKAGSHGRQICSVDALGPAVLALLLAACSGAAPPVAGPRAKPAAATGQTAIQRADPSVVRDGDLYYAVESDSVSLYVRSARSPQGLSRSEPLRIAGPMTHVWAPELLRAGDTWYVYFAAGTFTEQRMYYVAAKHPTRRYSAPVRLDLADDKWAIDGVPFRYRGQWWFVWSGWPGDANLEQDLYLARMRDPVTPSGPRYLVSRPSERWERSVGNPYVNEGPQPIVDPSGMLHIAYSANGSWSADYCVADLRLRADGDPSRAQDWYKSEGCLLGANAALMRPGWQAATQAKGVGHLSFLLPEGDAEQGPRTRGMHPFLYHGVPGELPMHWDNRFWYTGSYSWVADVSYCRTPGDCTTGWSLRFFE
jgi:GH43 family beta-xylosidase